MSYPALDPSGTPASLSPEIIGFLREELGFGGMVATDALVMEAVSASGRSEAEAAVAAVRAGCDVVLYPQSTEDTIKALAAALDKSELDPQRVAEAGYRILTAAASVRIHEEGPVALASYAQALEMASASVRLIRGSWPPVSSGTSVRIHVVDDDDIALPSFIAAPGLVPPDRGRLSVALAQRDVNVGDAASLEPTADLVALFSEVKAWKGRSELAPDTIEQVEQILAQAPAAAVIVFGHARLAEQLPFADNVICAWCGDALMQDAVAERFVAATA